MSDWAAPTEASKKQYAKPSDSVCEICGGEWTKRWEDDATDGYHLPIYEGGTLHVVRENGASYAYRCKCFASKRGLPAPPAHLWNRFVKEGKEIRL